MNTALKPFLDAQSAHPLWAQSFRELTTGYDPEYQLLTYYMQPTPRPSFTPSLLRDIESFQEAVRNTVSRELRRAGETTIKYLVHASAMPGVFNLGGDLGFFLNTIRDQDRGTLSDYAHLSIKVLYQNLRNLDLPITTVAMLEGTALGAALEAALSSDVIIAERHVQIGFPEVVFNMFPGMGAYSFLARRLSPNLVERMIMSGKIYSAEELYEMGVIDILAEQGGARDALYAFVRRDEKTQVTRKALLRMRERVNPITYEELLYIAELWVDSALSLPEKDLRMMERLMKAQNRRIAATPAAAARSQG